MIATDEAFRPGDRVRLVNSHGLKVVTVFHRSKLLRTPNPTAAEIVAGPDQSAGGVEFYHVRLSDGPCRGKLVSCSPNVIRGRPHGLQTG